jgi:hypothetical protein
MSSHPNPGNRTVYIAREAEALTIARAADDRDFQPIKTAFASMPAPLTMAELARRKPNPSGDTARSVGTPGQPVPRPSAEYKAINGGKLFVADGPANWTSLTASNAIRVVPENGYGDVNGQTVFSHGVEFGIAQAGTRDLRQATMTWLKAVAQSNPDLRMTGEQQSVRLDQRSAIATPLVNTSQLGGQEMIGLYTTFLADGTLFYYLTIVKDTDAQAFQETFRRIGGSIRFTDAR